MNSASYYPAKRVAPNVFVGSRRDAEDRDFMRRNDIRLIVNCSRDIPMFFDRDIKSYRVPVDDDPSDAPIIARYLPIAALMINDVTRYGHNVLVHCHAGMNRSATVAAGYLMMTDGLSADQAVARIKRCKPECFQPSNFASSLRSWETKLRALKARRARAQAPKARAPRGVVSGGYGGGYAAWK